MQKKTGLFIALFLSLSVLSSAQFKKGMRMVGTDIASLFFNSGNSDVTYPPPTTGFSYKTTSYGVSISPSMGWFISDNTAVGFLLNINPHGNKTSYEANGNTYEQDKLSIFNAGLGGFARSYFKSSSSFMPFGQFSLNLGISSQHTEGFFYGGSGAGAYKDTYDGKSSGGFFFNAALALGVTRMLNAHTGLDLFAGYNFSHNKSTYKTITRRDTGLGTVTSEDNRTINFTSHGATVGVGLQVFLDPKK